MGPSPSVQPDDYVAAFRYFGISATVTIGTQIAGQNELANQHALICAFAKIGNPELEKAAFNVYLNGRTHITLKNPHMLIVEPILERVKAALNSDDPDPNLFPDTNDGIYAEIAIGELADYGPRKFCRAIINKALTVLEDGNTPELAQGHAAMMLALGCRLLPDNGFDSLKPQNPTYAQMLINAAKYYNSISEHENTQTILGFHDRLKRLSQEGIADNPMLFAAHIFNRDLEDKLARAIRPDNFRAAYKHSGRYPS